MNQLLVPFLALVPGVLVPPQEPRQAAPAAAPALHSALAPADRLGEAWWKERFDAANARIAQGDVDLIFLGDSITQGWEDVGKDIWAEFYGKRKALNLGFSGDRTQHVLWRLERHGLEALAKPPAGLASPRLVVLMIGTNNSNGADNTAQEIADGISAVVRSLRSRLPETKVLILAIFPRGAKPDEQRGKNAQASALAAKIADGKMVRYLDIGPKFLAEDGTLTTDIMPDLLHLSPTGYGIWAESIEPVVAELLREKR
jgi:beta-glucosidase